MKEHFFGYLSAQRGSEPAGSAEAFIHDQGRDYEVTFEFDNKNIHKLTCSCGTYILRRWGSERSGLVSATAYAGTGWRFSLLFTQEDYILRYNPGDAMDDRAAQILQEFEERSSAATARAEDTQILHSNFPHRKVC